MRDRTRDGGERDVDVGIGRREPKTQSYGRQRVVPRDAHGREHVRRFGRTRRTRRTGRCVHTERVEQQEQCLGFDTTETEMRVALDLARAIAVLERVGYRREQPVGQSIAQRPDTSAISLAVLDRRAQRSRERDCARDVGGAGLGAGSVP